MNAVLDETIFHENSEKALNQLLEFAENLENTHEIEVNLDSGVLSIIMPDDKEYIINKHTPSRQIWVSSPYSGAGYFEFNQNNWVPKRSDAAKGKSLHAFISEEIMLHLD
jgi:frataxin